MNSFFRRCLSTALAAGGTILPFAIPADAPSAAEPRKYIGPDSCAATSCHASVKPAATSQILQTEYTTWILKDKHSRAYQALTREGAERMARIFILGDIHE